VQLAEPGHAHELGAAVDFRGAGAAFPRLTVPADGEVGGVLRLDLVHRVQDHHALGGFGGVVAEGTLAPLAPPDGESRGSHLISSTILCNSSGIGGIGSLRSSILPSDPFCTTRLKPP